jgi:deoxyribonuclease-4
MRFGFHISIAGGFSKVVERAKIRGCETIQFFSRNPRGWKYGPLDKEDVGAFRSSMKTSTLFPVFLHLPYLANIACPKSKFYSRSIKSIVTDLQRAEQLGAQYLIIHIGHRMEFSEDEAMEAVSKGIDQAFEKVKNSVILLLETRRDNAYQNLKKFGNRSTDVKGYPTFSTLTAQTLYSGILATGSRASMVRRLAAASLKWKVMNTMPGGT